MKNSSRKIVVVVLALAAVGDGRAESDAPAPDVPAEIIAMLQEHRGRWRTEGQWISHGKAKPVVAAWECKAAVDGIGNVCTWHHEWADRPADVALEVMGYDPELVMLSISRVTDRGLIGTVTVRVRGNTMTRRWESIRDGKKSVGRNEIVVKAPGEWVQQMTVEVDGERVTEMNVTHRRTE